MRPKLGFCQLFSFTCTFCPVWLFIQDSQAFLLFFLILYGSCYLQVLSLLSQAAQKDNKITSSPTLLLQLTVTLNIPIMEKIRARSQVLAFLKYIYQYCNNPELGMDEEKRIARGEGKEERARKETDRNILLIQCYTLVYQPKSKMKKGKFKVTLRCEAISIQRVPWKAFQHFSC